MVQWRPPPPASFYSRWSQYGLSRPHFRLLANSCRSDCLDFLLRFRATSRTPRLYRFFCSAQRTPRIDAQRKTLVTTLQQWPPRNNGIRQSSTTNVYLGTTQWLRNLIPRVRLPRRFGRSPGSQRFAATIRWACADIAFPRANTNDRRTPGRRPSGPPRSPTRRELSHRVSIPGQSHLLV